MAIAPAQPANLQRCIFTSFYPIVALPSQLISQGTSGSDLYTPNV